MDISFKSFVLGILMRQLQSSISLKQVLVNVRFSLFLLCIVHIEKVEKFLSASKRSFVPFKIHIDSIKIVN